MNIIRRLIYFCFILLLSAVFIFLGGGRALIRVGKEMEKWELSMKEKLGCFCQQGEIKIRNKSSNVKDSLSRQLDGNEK